MDLYMQDYTKDHEKLKKDLRKLLQKHIESIKSKDSHNQIVTSIVINVTSHDITNEATVTTEIVEGFRDHLQIISSGVLAKAENAEADIEGDFRDIDTLKWSN